MCCRGTRASDGNMRQRREIVQREALGVQLRAQLPVGNAAFNRHAGRLRVESNQAVHSRHREQPVSAICNAVEAMTRTEDLDPAVPAHELLNVLYGSRMLDEVGTV